MTNKQAIMRTEKVGMQKCYRVRFMGFWIGVNFNHNDRGREAAVRLRDDFNKSLDKWFGSFRDKCG